MKIRVSFTVDLDARGWAAEYGLDASEVREDFQRYVADGITGELDSRGLLADGATGR